MLNNDGHEPSGSDVALQGEMRLGFRGSIKPTRHQRDAQIGRFGADKRRRWHIRQGMWSYRYANQAMKDRTALSDAMGVIRAWDGFAGGDVRLFHRLRNQE